MIRELSILILALSISTYALNAADNDDELDEYAGPPFKKRSVVKNQELTVDLSFRYEKDVVKLNLSRNKYLTDINFVLCFPTLRDINLSHCYNLKNNYKQISSLTNITKLNLQSVCLGSLHHISSLINLTDLNLSFNFLKRQKIKYLISLKKLKILILSGNRDITDLERLPELKSITNLNLSEILCYEHNTDAEPIYKSIDFLTEMKSLSTLIISRSDCLTHIKPLTKITTLTNLSLFSCCSIKDLKNLTKIKSLKELDLRYSNLEYVGSDLNELKFLNKLIISPDMTLPPSFSKQIKRIISS